MKSLSQGKKQVGHSGEAICNPFPQLASEGVHLRRGQLHLIAAAPGIGKSALILYWAMVGENRKKVDRVLYLSADSDPAVQYKRAAQVASGYSNEFISEQLRSAPEWVDQVVTQGTAHMRFDFDSYPDADHILNQVNAYLEIYGVYPDLIIMDNAKNVRLGDDSRTGEFDELEGTMEFLQQVARETNSAVVTLHHVTGTYEDGDRAVPLSGIRGKVTKTPETILTLFRGYGQTFVVPVKNRDGKADSAGGVVIALQSDLSRMHYA